MDATPPKSPATSRATTPEPLARRLGPLALWLLVINGMIGAGIFGIPAGAQRLAGDFSPWLFVLGAVLIAPVMLCFAQLSSALRATGGPALYARTAFGPFAGFQIGWAFYIARLTAFAANLNLLVTSIAYFWPDMGPSVRLGLLAVLCGSMVWVNITGAKAAMRSLGVLTILKLLPLVALALVGLAGLDRAVFESVAQPPRGADLGAAVLLVIYAYVGFESGVVPAGESRNPQRDMPRALLLALAVSAGIYVLVQVATQRLVPDLANAERPIVDAGRELIGQPGAVIVVLAIIASVGGNLLGSMFSTARITYRLALDRQLPALFARVHPTHGTPWFSVLVYGVAAFALAATGTFAWLAVLSVFTRLLIYLTCIGAMPRVHARSPDPEADPETAETDSNSNPDARIRLPGGPTIPVLAGLVCIGLLTRVSVDSVIATAIMLAAGSVLFLITAARRPLNQP